MKLISKEARLNAINDYQRKISPKLICQKYQVSKSTLYNWLKLYTVRIDTITGEKFTYKELQETNKLLEKKTKELEVYELSHCCKNSPTRQKEEAIENIINTFGDRYSIRFLCKTLDLPKGTFYNYHLRRVNETQNQKRNEFLKEQILKVFNESGQRFSAKKIQIKLASMDIHTKDSKVTKLMKELNIKSNRRKNKVYQSQENHYSKYYKNFLKREFTQSEPNKFWVSDVTYLNVKSAKFYLCVILDLFSRKIIAYRLSSQNNDSLTVNTFKDAFEGRNRPQNLCFHSDQGTNYTSKNFRDLLLSLKVKQSFSRKGTPLDNSVAESFFSNFKQEEINSKNFEFFDELKESVDSYMQYYNDYRPHNSLKNKTPNQVETDYELEVLNGLSK